MALLFCWSLDFADSVALVLRRHNEVEILHMRLLVLSAVLLGLCWNTPRAQDLSELRSKANAGDAAAQFELGLYYDNRNRRNRDERQAVDWYSKSADQGFARAQFRLGRMYILGRGTERNETRGVALQVEAAEQGLAEAQLAIGKRYLAGVVLEQDFQKALELFEGAANQGLVDAQNQLGSMYFQGQGVEKDVVRAHMWFSIAAENNDRVARRYLPVLEGIMDEAQIESARAQAKLWLAERVSE